jgi:Zn-dependent protease with chaperone function
LKFNNQLPDDDVNVTKHSAIGDLSWMLGGLFVFILVVYFSLGIIVEYAVKHISIEQEQKIFSYLNLNKLATSNKSDIPNKLQILVDSSEKCTKSSYKFIVNVSESNETNAYAMPGGIIVVTQALVDNATSENELFFVLAHEIGHFQNRDHLEGIGQGFVAMAISSLIGLSDTSELLQTSLSFSESYFSKSKESEADLYAVDLMECYYGHVNGSTDFFKHLPKTSDYDLFSTHPKTIHRIDMINNYIDKKKYTRNETKKF